MAPFTLLQRNAALFLVAAVLYLSVGVLRAADDPPVDAKAEAALKTLADRCQDASGDKDKLVQDAQAFRLAHPGTPYAVRAAALLSSLPSPSGCRNAPGSHLDSTDWR